MTAYTEVRLPRDSSGFATPEQRNLLGQRPVAGVDWLLVTRTRPPEGSSPAAYHCHRAVPAQGNGSGSGAFIRSSCKFEHRFRWPESQCH